MNKIKISSLGILDEYKFKKLGNDRDNWLTNGEDSIKENNDFIKFAAELKPKMVEVIVKRILSENENFKTFVLHSKKSTSLPLFKAGQMVSVTLEIDGNKFSNSYYLSSNPDMARAGEWRITIQKSDDEVTYYLFNYLKVGENLSLSSPFGEFYYNPLRDGSNVIAFVSSYGIIPIYSMVQDFCSGLENFNLIIFYLAKKESQMIFVNELKRYCLKSDKIKVNFVLSEEKREGYLNGFVSLDMINKFYKENDTSFFISIDDEMKKNLLNLLCSFNLEKKFWRFDDYLPINKVIKKEIFNLRIYINDEKYDIPCYNNLTIMQAIYDGRLYIPSKCHKGSCGFCRAELLYGNVKVVNDKRSVADKKFNYIHPCTTYPLSDIVIIVR